MSYFLRAAFAGLRCSHDFQQRNTVALLPIRLFSILLFCTTCFFTIHVATFNIAAARAMGSEERASHGKLLVASPHSNIVIVDTDRTERHRIVGGRLAQDATLIRGKRKVSLSDFQVGEYVKILWRHTKTGREIIALVLTDPPPAPHPVPPRTSGTIHASPTLFANDGNRLYTSQVQPIIGYRVSHVVGSKETFLKIARNYSLGYNEMVDLYPQYDPWLPPEGQRFTLPTVRILPDTKREDIVINIAELRLYYYHKRNGIPMVTTFPISIGTPESQTPLGHYHIASKTVNPTWTVPPSLRYKYTFRSLPPGPDNPLGKYWLGLSIRAYGIHGTNIAWSVGRTITQGCIRMYPEDIERFFDMVTMGTKVNLVYQPIKTARYGNRVYIEVHKDVYSKYLDLYSLASEVLSDKDLWPLVDRNKLEIALRGKSGVPVDITNNALRASR